ncbi:MAG TPA: hypothetical protein VKH19_00865 [Gemmatimonadaceae bacterium]|nr:hypothetical protein [Gemmatimonadaceae bacterium]
MLARPGEREPAGPDSTAFARHGNLLRAGEILSGERALVHARHRRGEHHLAAALAAAGAELDHVIGRPDRLQIVLDDQHGVAAVAQTREQPQQPRHVARVEADRRLVQHVQRVHELRAQRVREADALRLATGKRTRAAIQREIVETDVAQELDAIARLLEDVRGDARLEFGELEVVEPAHELIHGQLGDLRHVLIGDADLQRVRLELRATA